MLYPILSTLFTPIIMLSGGEWTPLSNCWEYVGDSNMVVSADGGILTDCPSGSMPDHWTDTVRSCTGANIRLEFPDANVSDVYFELTSVVPKVNECLTLVCWFAPNKQGAVNTSDQACMFGFVGPMFNYARASAMNRDLRFTRCEIRNVGDHYLGNFQVVIR